MKMSLWRRASSNKDRDLNINLLLALFVLLLLIMVIFGVPYPAVNKPVLMF